MNNELDFLRSVKEKMDKLVSFGHEEIDTCDSSDADEILEACRKAVTILSKRMRDMRQLKVKKQVFLCKMLEKCQSNWRDGQYAMIISSIKTAVYLIENVIEDILTCNGTRCSFAATISKACQFLSMDKKINLNCQSNLVCLGSAGIIKNPSLLKQRSEAWHAIYNSCIVTGSTINTAIGRDHGLKKTERLFR